MHMKTTALVATALIALSSTAAMADSFTARASASLRFSGGVSVGAPTNNVIVRDHRHEETRYPAQTPVYFDRSAPRYNEIPTPAPMPTAGLDCRNWDPALEASSACSVYSTGRVAAPRNTGAWISLGTREASVPDIEYITVENSFRQLYVAPVKGQPALTSVAIKFMDGTWQTVNLDSSFARGQGKTINVVGGLNHEISQIVFHSVDGARGAYTTYAL